MVNDKFVLVKSYYGMGGDLCVLLGGMEYAARTGRTVVVDWDNGFYGEATNGEGLFFTLFTNGELRGAQAIGREIQSVYPPYWAPYIHSPALTFVAGIPLAMSRPEEVPAGCGAECVVITRDSRRLRSSPNIFFRAAASLRLAPDIQERVDAAGAASAGFKRTIGVHYRHGNGEHKVIPPDPGWFRNRINQYIRDNELEPDEVLLLVATDCEKAVEYFRRYYKNCIDIPKAYPPAGAGPFHVNREGLTNAQKIELAREALVDMYVLSRSNCFIGSGGFFSLFVRLLRKDVDCVVYQGNRVYADYDFSPVYFPIKEDLQLSSLLARYGHPLDGVFARIEGGQKNIYYYDKHIYSLPASHGAISAVEGLKLRQALVKYRLY